MVIETIFRIYYISPAIMSILFDALSLFIPATESCLTKRAFIVIRDSLWKIAR